MLLNKSRAMCLLECLLECRVSVYKRLCNGERANCTPPLERCMVATFRGMCGCAVAHACTYAHASLKGAWILVRAAVRTCISKKNFHMLKESLLNIQQELKEAEKYKGFNYD